ncbi:MAG: MFS transporter [Acidobacteria bacterium]|nr:MFS transporter [Acidobacteriota bacterium]
MDNEAAAGAAVSALPPAGDVEYPRVDALPRSRQWSYGAPAFALALFGVPVFVHLPKFYADVAGAPLGALGTAILLTRVFDGVTDPVIGALSDRARTRWGRRRPFLVIGALPLALSVIALFAPPSGAAAAPWFLACMTLAFLAWTVVQIPYQALGTELAGGHHGRTTLFAIRDGLWMLGTLVAAAAPALVRAVRDATGAPPNEAAVFRTLGVAYAVLLASLPLWCAWRVPEPAAPVARQPGLTLDGLAGVWRGNRPYRLLLLAYAVASLGGALPGTLLFFYVEQVLQAPAATDALLGLYFVAGFAGLPVWTWASRRLGKLRAFLGATLLSVGVFLGALWLGPGDVMAFAGITVLSGLGFGATLLLPASMLADTLDFEALRSGTRREGLLLGVWGIVMKASAAIGAGVALPLLGWWGYVSGAGSQTPEAVQAIRLLYCAVPCACYAVALAISARYPIDAHEHARILRELEARSARV